MNVVQTHAPIGSTFPHDDMATFYDKVRVDLEAGPWPDETVQMETESNQLIGGYSVTIAADAQTGPEDGGGVVQVDCAYPSNEVKGYRTNFGAA